jgi:UV DNA damage endonuclease
MPQPNQHSDFINPFEFIHFLRRACQAHARPFDIMLEAKARDLALLRLRDQVAQHAPDLLQTICPSTSVI